MKSATSSWPCRSCDNTDSYAWRAIAIFDPIRMLPLMSTRIARLSGDSLSDRIERIGRNCPLSRTSKYVEVRPVTIRPRASRTDLDGDDVDCAAKRLLRLRRFPAHLAT